MHNQETERLLDELLVHVHRTSTLTRIASRIMMLKGKTRDVAQFILSNTSALSDMTIEEIAAACGASRATVLRMSNELGFDNFSQLRKELLGVDGGEALPEPPSAPYVAMKRCLAMLLNTYSTVDTDRIEQAAELLVGRDPIAVYGGAMSGGVARVIQNRFRWLGLSAYASSDIEGLVNDMRQRTEALFCVSHVGSAPNVMRVLSQAQQNNVPIVLLVNLEGSSACKFADVVLATGITTVRTDGYDILARTSQLYMIELLCDAIERKIKADP